MKICNKCEVKKAPNQFPRRGAVCTDCRNIRRAEIRAERSARNVKVEAELPATVPTLKTCRVCGETKAARHFYLQHNGVRLRGECKACASLATQHRRKYGATMDPYEHDVERRDSEDSAGLFALPETELAKRQLRIAQHAARVSMDLEHGDAA